MSTITRQQAQQIIEAADEVITALAGTNEDVHPDNSTKMVRLYDDLNDHYAPPEVVRELARIALASLEAEPVLNVQFKNGWPVDGTAGIISGSPGIADGYHDFYTAPQLVPKGYLLAPKEPDAAWIEKYCELSNRHPDGEMTTFIGDGAVTITFREKSKRELEIMLAALMGGIEVSDGKSH